MKSIGQGLRAGRLFSSWAGSSAVVAHPERGLPSPHEDLRTVGGRPSKRTGDSHPVNRRGGDEAEAACAATGVASGGEHGLALAAAAVQRWNAGGAASSTQGGWRQEPRGTNAHAPAPLHPEHHRALGRGQNGGTGLLRRRRSLPEARLSSGQREREDGNDVRSGRRGNLDKARHAGAGARAWSGSSNNRAHPSPRTTAAAAEVETSLELEQASIMRRLKRAKVRRDGEEARRILEDALAQDDAAELVDVFVFSAAVGVFAKVGRWEAALEVLGTMRQKGVRPNEFTYNQAISACGNGGAWSWAVYLLKAMPRVGLTPDVVSHNAAIGACARAGQIEVAAVLLREMSEAGGRLAPNAITYNTVLSALAPATMTSRNAAGDAAPASADASRWKLAVGLLEEMREKEIARGPESYAPAVAACVAGDQARAVVKLLRQMRREDRITPDLESYNAAMAACRRAGEWELAVVLLAEVKEADGVIADGVTYAEVIEACRKGGQSDLAASLSEESQEARRKARVVAGGPAG